MSTALVQYWTEDKCAAVGMLAMGRTYAEAGAEAGVSPRTIANWMRNPEFAEEVDRLTLMVGESSRAERIRRAMRVLRNLENENGVLTTNKDSLDWLKYVQSETDGVKVDVSKLLALDDSTTDSSRQLGPSQGVVGPAIDVVASIGDNSEQQSLAQPAGLDHVAQLDQPVMDQHDDLDHQPATTTTDDNA